MGNPGPLGKLLEGHRMTAIETLAADWAQDCHPLHPEADGGKQGQSLRGGPCCWMVSHTEVRQLGTEFFKGFWERRKKVKDLTEGL